MRPDTPFQPASPALRRRFRCPSSTAASTSARVNPSCRALSRAWSVQLTETGSLDTAPQATDELASISATQHAPHFGFAARPPRASCARAACWQQSGARPSRLGRPTANTNPSAAAVGLAQAELRVGGRHDVKRASVVVDDLNESAAWERLYERAGGTRWPTTDVGGQLNPRQHALGGRDCGALRPHVVDCRTRKSIARSVVLVV